jgi:hypothetical protein
MIAPAVVSATSEFHLASKTLKVFVPEVAFRA